MCSEQKGDIAQMHRSPLRHIWQQGQSVAVVAGASGAEAPELAAGRMALQRRALPSLPIPDGAASF